MVKLPKDIQKKQKEKPKRQQLVKKRPGSGNQQYGSRQMRRKMQAQGIDMDQIEATRVIIECTNKTLVIEQPEVVLMKQMGQEIYQVVGDAEEYGPDEFHTSESQEIETEAQVEETDLKPSITENDIMLVAAQANVPKEEAEAVLNDCNGDIAKAIIFLKSR